MELVFKKSDFWVAALVGEICIWLALPTLKNLKAFDLILEYDIAPETFLFLGAVFLPLAAVFSLYFFFWLARVNNRPGFFQLGKYGIIGVLNTLLYAGVFNLLIFFTDISSGFWVNGFLVLAFIITVTNSFFWNKYWSFEERRGEMGREAIKFFLVSGSVALVNITILHLVVNVIGAPQGIDGKVWANFGLVITIVTAFLGNFFGYKFLVFKK